LREWFAVCGVSTAKAELNPSERRLLESELRRRRRWSFGAAVLCIAVILALAGEFAYARVANAAAPAKLLDSVNGQVRVSLSDLSDSSLHFYTADVNETMIRFMLVHQTNGNYAVALDACQICGRMGYRQEGQNVICRNCGAAIYIPSIGDRGGCNPIPVKSVVAGGEVIIDLSALASSNATIHS
jgi:uncharacterized membrane protein